MNKRVTALGLSAGLLAGAGAGLILEMAGSAGASANVVSAVNADTTDTSNTSNTSTAAANPAADADHTARLQSVLQPLVDDATLTQAQADAVIAALEAAGPMDGGHRGPGMGGPGMGGPGANLDTVAAVLGITVDEVRTGIQGGQTIAQLAEANGTTAQAVIDALVAQATTHVDEEVAAGKHTQAEGDAELAEATTRITDFVNNTQTAGPGPGGPGHHGHGPGDQDGDANGAGTDTGSGTSTIDGGPSDTSATISG